MLHAVIINWCMLFKKIKKKKKKEKNVEIKWLYSVNHFNCN